MSSPDDAHAEAVRDRFARTAALVAEREESRREELREQVRAFVQPSGDERVLDSGTGTGALAFAIAPLVREVVGVDLVPELLEQARSRAGVFPNVSFLEGDATRLPFEEASFDLAASVRTLHHVARPELAVSELTRVTRRPARRRRAERVRARARPIAHPRPGGHRSQGALRSKRAGLAALAVRRGAAGSRPLPRSRALRGRCA